MFNIHKMVFLTTLISGTLITLSSYSWMGMWMGLEINLLSIIPLMNSSKNKMASESSLKYFITQAMASTVLIYALIIMSLKESMNPWMIHDYTPLMINIPLIMKMGAAPLHFWFPEVMEGLSWMNTFIMMTWQKIAPMSAMLSVPKSISLIQATVLCSIVMGGLMGINQTSLRKILAYSSINHLGWMLSVLMINLSITMNYFLMYAFISLNLVLILNAMNVFQIQSLFMIKNNLLKISFLSNLLSMGGVPPFIGFLPKWMVLNYLAKINLSMAISMAILTLLTLFLYVRSIIPFFTLENSETKNCWINKPSFTMWWTNGTNILSLILCTTWFNLT